MRNKKVTVTGANKLFFLFAILFLGFQILLGILSIILRKSVSDNAYLMIFINEYIIILIPVVIYALVKRLDFKEVFRFRKFGILPALLIIAMSIPAYFAAAMLNTFLLYLLQFIGEIPQSAIPIPQNVGELIIGLILVALTPALCEEMLNRGIMLKAYENRGSIKAMVITAIFFGVFHFDITNLLGPIFLGLLIGYYAIRTNSIFAAMLAHFMNNAFAEVISYIYRAEYSAAENTVINLEDLGVTALYGVAGLIILYVLLKLFNRVTKQSAVIKPPISGIKKDIVSIMSHWPVVITACIYVLLTLLFILIIVSTNYLR